MAFGGLTFRFAASAAARGGRSADLASLSSSLRLEVRTLSQRATAFGSLSFFSHLYRNVGFTSLFYSLVILRFFSFFIFYSVVFILEEITSS